MAARSSMNQLAPIAARTALPAIITAAGDRAGTRFLEFFASAIRNPHTRRAYGRAVGGFLAWWVRRPIRVKLHGKKREHGRNSRDFGLESADLFRRRRKEPVYCLQSWHAIRIGRGIGY